MILKKLQLGWSSPACGSLIIQLGFWWGLSNVPQGKKIIIHDNVLIACISVIMSLISLELFPPICISLSRFSTTTSSFSCWWPFTLSQIQSLPRCQLPLLPHSLQTRRQPSHLSQHAKDCCFVENNYNFLFSCVYIMIRRALASDSSLLSIWNREKSIKILSDSLEH